MKYLITGAAGFIGSNLLKALLKQNQQVVGLDNFSTGYEHNLDDVCSLVSKDQWNNFTFIQGDIRDLQTCRKACENIDYVLHQAALGSVPRSIEDPIATNQSNIDGFVNMLVAARDAHVKRFVYAASSSTYGDHPDLPKQEDMVRAKVVKHPRKWEHGGYHEIVKAKQRYRTIDRKEVTRLLDVEEKELGRQYQGWIKEALKQGNLRRNGVWSSELAVGDDGFVEKVKKSVGAWVYPACRACPVHFLPVHWDETFCCFTW